MGIYDIETSRGKFSDEPLELKIQTFLEVK